MISINRWRVKFVFGMSICMTAFTGIDHSAAQTRPPHLRACARCHGFNGIGRNSDTPNLAGQNRDYMRLQLDAFLSGRRRHPDMTDYAEYFSDRELNDVIEYYSRLSPP